MTRILVLGLAVASALGEGWFSKSSDPVPQEADPGSASRQVPRIESDAKFEAQVISSPHCTAVLFVESIHDTKDARHLVRKMGKDLGVDVAVAEVDAVKAISSEFNVRKRMVPRMLVFNTRSRQAVVIKLKGDNDELIPMETVKQEVTEALKDNKHVMSSGHYEKLTLTIASDEL